MESWKLKMKVTGTKQRARKQAYGGLTMMI